MEHFVSDDDVVIESPNSSKTIVFGKIYSPGGQLFSTALARSLAEACPAHHVQDAVTEFKENVLPEGLPTACPNSSGASSQPYNSQGDVQRLEGSVHKADAVGMIPAPSPTAELDAEEVLAHRQHTQSCGWVRQFCWRRQIFFVYILILLTFVIFAASRRQGASFDEYKSRLAKMSRKATVIRQNPEALLFFTVVTPFILISPIRNMLSTLIGFIFSWWGLVVLLIGHVMGCTVVFFSARYFFKGCIIPKFFRSTQKAQSPTLIGALTSWLEAHDQRDLPIRTIVLLAFCPIAPVFLSFAFGMACDRAGRSGVSFKNFIRGMIVAVLKPTPFVIVGCTVRAALEQDDASLTGLAGVIVAAVLHIVFGVGLAFASSFWATRRFLKHVNQFPPPGATQGSPEEA